MPNFTESNRFATLVDSRGFAKLDESRIKRRRSFFEDCRSTQKYVVVKKLDEPQKSFIGVSPFLIEKGLSMITTYIQETQRLRSGDLLVLTNKEEGFQKLINATKLGDIPIKVEEHKFLNLSKGVIYSRDLMMVDEAEIQKELENQKVVKVERIKRKINNELKDTPLHIITFNMIELPMYIKAGFLRLDVRQYIPNPMRCHTCQRYGHTKNRCERVPVCPKCANFIPKGHEGIKCEPIKCANCKMEHTTFDQTCPTYQMEKEIIKIKTIDRITYFKAKEIYYRQNANTTGATKPGQSKQLYSEVLQKNTEKYTNMNTNNNNADHNNNNNNNNTNNDNNYNNNNNYKNNSNNNNNNNENRDKYETVQNINKSRSNNSRYNNNTNEQQNKTNYPNTQNETRMETTTTIDLTATTSNNTTQLEPTTRRYKFLSPSELALVGNQNDIEIE